MIETRLGHLEERVGEVRRDQINYRIAEDLLKSTYASNFQTVNTVLAIILGVFTVVGALGLRSVGAMARDFHQELRELSELKARWEKQIDELQDVQGAARDKLVELTEKNSEQDRRLKILEIQEAVTNLIRGAAPNYEKALEYIAVGSDMDPQNPFFQRAKCRAFFGLRRYAEAAAAGRVVYETNPEDIGNAANLAEAYLFVQRVADFDTLFAKHRGAFADLFGDYVLLYFEALRAFASNDVARLRSIGLQAIKDQPVPKRSWDFNDVRTHLRERRFKNGPLLMAIVDYLSGASSADHLSAVLEPKS